MLTHIGLKRLTTDPLHNVTSQRHAVVGVCRGGTRCESLSRRFVLDVGLQVRPRGEAAVFLEARRVSQQMTQGQGLIEAPLNLKVQVGTDIGIEIHLALLHQLHRRDGGRDLGDRGQAEQGRLRVYGHRLTARGTGVGPPVAAGGHHLPVLDHGHHGAGDVAVLEGIGQLPIQPGVDVLGRELMLTRWRLTRRQTGRRRRRPTGGQQGQRGQQGHHNQGHTPARHVALHAARRVHVHLPSPRDRESREPSPDSRHRATLLYGRRTSTGLRPTT